MKKLVTLATIFLGILAIVFADVGYKIVIPSGFTLIGTSQKSKLYTVDLPNGTYEDPIYILDLHGSFYEMGYDYGKLLGKQTVENYNNFLASLIGTSGLDHILITVLALALDWQWDDYLSTQLPQCYIDELQGIHDGAKSIGIEDDVAKIISRTAVLANAPGDPSDFLYILLREFEGNYPAMKDAVEYVISHLKKKIEPTAGLQCSMLAAWGNRTKNGSLFSSRNLDWNSDSGIQKNKLLTIYHPNGKIPHATVGYACLDGALTGMSSAGLTVHEANLEEDKITFEGFPWIFRLRYVMENAHNLKEAKAIWDSTNNTVGFNHMIASASDVVNGHAALVEETMFQYTAYFEDNDERENTAYVDDNGNKVKIGYPLPEALWRTNHGYDPIIRQNFEWSQSPNSSTIKRYMYIHNGLVYYENAGIKIGELETINITAIAADKGSNTPYKCQNSNSGSNVISAVYNPSSNRMYASWENGHAEQWRPACCNSYVLFDMSKWW